MHIPFVDLKAQYLSIQQEIDKSIKDVIEQTAFIGGTYVKKFESQATLEILNKYMFNLYTHSFKGILLN